MKNFFSSFVLCLVFEVLFSQGTWTRKTDFPGSSRNFGLGFSIGTKGYFGMGQKQIKYFVYKSYNDFWEYDSEKDSWTQKADFPGEGRLRSKGFLINKKIYVGFGYVIAAYGPNAGSNDYYADLYEFLPDSNKWIKKHNNLMGRDIFFVVKDTMYSVNPEERSFKKYNPLTDTSTENKWDKKAIALHYSDAIGSFSIAEKEFVITAITKKGKDINQLWEFDPRTILWKQKNDLPSPGSYDLNSFSIGEKGYVMRRGNDFLEYESTPDTWAFKKIMPVDSKNFYHLFSIGEKSYGLSQHEFWEFIP